MFTGLVQWLAEVRQVRAELPGKRIDIDCPELAASEGARR